MFPRALEDKKKALSFAFSSDNQRINHHLQDPDIIALLQDVNMVNKLFDLTSSDGKCHYRDQYLDEVLELINKATNRKYAIHPHGDTFIFYDSATYTYIRPIRGE